MSSLGSQTVKIANVKNPFDSFLLFLTISILQSLLSIKNLHQSVIISIRDKSTSEKDLPIILS